MTSSIYINDGINFSKKIPYIYKNNEWVSAIPVMMIENSQLEELSGNLINITNGLKGQTFEEFKIEIPYTEAGLTTITLVHCGKNLINDQIVLKPSASFTQLDLHEFSGTSSSYRSWYGGDTLGVFRHTIGSPADLGRLTVSFDAKNPETYTSSGGYHIYCVYTDGTSNAIIGKKQVPTYTHDMGRSTAGKSVSKIWYTYGGSTTMRFKNFQIEVGGTETAFEPYNGQTYTINFNKTIYGGVVDILNGTLTSTLASDGTELAAPEISAITPIRIVQKSGINNFMVSALGNIVLKYYSSTYTFTNKTLNGRYITFNDGLQNGTISNCKVTFPAVNDVTYSGIKFYHQGANLFPSTFPSSKIAGDLGSGGVSSASNARVFTIPCEPNTDYYFNHNPNTTWLVGFTDIESPVVGDTAVNYKGNMLNRNNAIWASENKHFIILRVGNETSFYNSKNNQIQIRKSNGVTSYPYEDIYFKEYVYNFEEPITSGELDLLTGKLTDQDGNEHWFSGLPSLATLKGINNFSVGDLNATLSLTYQTYATE